VIDLGSGARASVGLDVGSYSVKLVALPPGGGRARFAEAVIPGPAGGEDAAGPTVLAGLIDECLNRIEQSPRGIRGISIGVSGPDVIVKQLPLPLMDESELPGAIRFEARKHVPFDVQTMVLDHQVLARHPAERRLDVLLAAVSQHRLDRALAPLRELGIEANIVDAAPLALANALAQASGRDAVAEGEARLLLDLGHRGSWFTIRQRGEPFFTRRLDWGGVHLSQAVAAALGASLEAAEAWKLDAGASLADPGPVAAAARSAVDRLADELRRSLAFYGTLAQLPDTLTLHACGGTTRLGGVLTLLGEQLGMPVSQFSPPEGGERAGRGPGAGPQYAQAYGLALRVA
jgi:type IV pilus assembly protein PilM